jgi:DNA polymerase-3 subunit gamma/tau
VLSRCLQFNLKPMPPALVAQHLAEVLAEENVHAETAALNLLARAAAGSMRDALSLTDQAIAYGGGAIEAAGVEAMLGTVRRDYLFDLLDALAANDADGLMQQAQQLAEGGMAFDAALQDMGSLLTQLALMLHAPDTIKSGAVEAGFEEERMQLAASHLNAETVQLYYQIALNGRRDLPYAPDELSGFCMTLLRMLAFAPGSGASAPGAGNRAPLERPAPARAATPPRAEPVPRAAMPAGAPAAAPAPSPAPVTTAPAVAAPVTATSPAPALIASESTPHAAWDWLAVVASLRLGGMAKMLADHCELVAQTDESVTLRVGEAHKHLLDRTYQDKLVAALRDKFGAALNVSIELGAAVEKTPQQVRTRIKDERQAEAVAAIESDPFVRELVEQFGGQIDASTIQPLGEST